MIKKHGQGALDLHSGSHTHFSFVEEGLPLTYTSSPRHLHQCDHGAGEGEECRHADIAAVDKEPVFDGVARGEISAVESEPDEHAHGEEEGREIEPVVQVDESPSKDAVEDPGTWLASDCDVLDDPHRVFEKVPPLECEKSNEEQAADPVERNAPAFDMPQQTDVECRQKSEVSRIEEEVVPLDVEEPQDAPGLLGGQAEVPELVHLRDVLAHVEDLVRKASKQERSEPSRHVPPDSPLRDRMVVAYMGEEGDRRTQKGEVCECKNPEEGFSEEQEKALRTE